MFEHALAVVSEIVKGLLRLGKDPLGGPAGSDTEPGGSLPLDACHPYGMRSRQRDPDKDAQGNPTAGCGLLVIERGGGDDGAIPTQDPRITTLPDEGKGGAQLYGWTGSAVSSIVISGDDGKIRATAPETIIGAEAAGALVKEQQLMTWITSALLPALASSPGGPIVVTPPSGLATTKLRSE